VVLFSGHFQRRPAQQGGSTLAHLNERSREIFRLIVDSYLTSGEATLSTGETAAAE
jgi:hypothetical protein